MDPDETTDGSAPDRDRSRRLFVKSVGVAGLGLAAGTAATVTADEHESGDATDDDGAAEDGGTEADDGPTEIDSPTVIDEPGEYVLVADIVPESMEKTNAIDVDLGETDGRVDLDGDGHTIDLRELEDREPRSGDCIAINPEARGGEDEGPGWFANVENVTLAGGARGVSTRRDTGGQFTDVTAIDNGTGFEFYRDGGTLTDCVLRANEIGALLSGSDIYGGSDVTFEHCAIEDSEDDGVRVVFGWASLDACRLVGNRTGLYVNYRDASGDISGSHVCSNEEYGVHADAGTDEETGEGDLEGFADARNNYWGAANGPSSHGDAAEPYEDPETGEPADGDGDAVSEGLQPGVSNVRFDPFEESTIDGAGVRR